MKKNKIKKIAIVLILLGLILIGVKFFQAKVLDKMAISKDSTPIVYTIKAGDSPLDIALDLEKKDIIKDSDYFYKLFLKNNGTLYANDYSIAKSMTPEEIYNILTSPVSNLESKQKLIITEGEQLTQVAKSISDELNLSQKDILAYWSNQENLKTWINKYSVLSNDILASDIKYPLEGYLYPATYDITANETLETLTTKILNETETEYAPYLKKNSPNNYSLHQELALASIVERETMKDKDKTKVAGVFYNRINQNMPLQSDITVLYAKGEQKDIVTYEDLKYESPYNTYLNEGLPPGPISSVSLKALEAVYNPDKNDYLYFFARQDTGEVLYSKTLEEHEKISKQYAWK